MASSRPNPAVVAEEEARAYDLAVQGYSVREIAKVLGYSHTTAHRRLRGAVARIPLSKVEESRKIVEGQLHTIINKCARLAEESDPELAALYLGRWLSAIDRLMRLLGLAAPTRVALLRDAAEDGAPDPIIGEAFARARKQAGSDP